jgi:hypothetical protein
MSPEIITFPFQINYNATVSGTVLKHNSSAPHEREIAYELAGNGVRGYVPVARDYCWEIPFPPRNGVLNRNSGMHARRQG